MEHGEILFDKIESYLSGKLPAEEAMEFERRLKQDPSLAELVDMHRIERLGMEYLVEKDLVQKLKDWEKNSPSGQDKKKSKWPWLLATLALAALLAVLTPQIRHSAREETKPALETPQPEKTAPRTDVPVAETGQKQKEGEPPLAEENKKKSNDYLALAASYYSLPENLGSYLRSGDAPRSDSVLNPGLEAFALGKYQQAAKAFSRIDPEKHPAEYELVREYLGHAFFKLGQYEKAASVFKAIAAQSAMTTLDRAEWYLALSLLPDYQKNRQEVNALLEKMTNPQSYHGYAANAETLKARLKQIGQ